jgi:uncharacterized membrane protein
LGLDDIDNSFIKMGEILFFVILGFFVYAFINMKEENRMDKMNKNSEYKKQWRNCFVWLVIFISCIYFWGWVIKLIGDLYIYLFI